METVHAIFDLLPTCFVQSPCSPANMVAAVKSPAVTNAMSLVIVQTRHCRRKGRSKSFNSNELTRMRFLEPVRVTVFEGEVPSLQLACSRRISELVAGSLLLEMLLSHHVQFCGCR